MCIYRNRYTPNFSYFSSHMILWLLRWWSENACCKICVYLTDRCDGLGFDSWTQKKNCIWYFSTQFRIQAVQGYPSCNLGTRIPRILGERKILKRTADHMPSKIELGLVRKISHVFSAKSKFGCSAGSFFLSFFLLNILQVQCIRPYFFRFFLSSTVRPSICLSVME